MSVQQQIKQNIEQTLAPIHLEIINESHKHVGHAGHDGSGESHFRLMVVSEAFEGLTRVARTRLVNEALQSVFDNGLHALSMKLSSGSEYEQ